LFQDDIIAATAAGHVGVGVNLRHAADALACSIDACQVLPPGALNLKQVLLVRTRVPSLAPFVLLYPEFLVLFCHPVLQDSGASAVFHAGMHELIMSLHGLL